MSDNTVVSPAGGVVVTPNGHGQNSGYGYGNGGGWNQGWQADPFGVVHSEFRAAGQRDLTSDIITHSKSVELAVEKTAAATALAVEKTSAASALASALNTAAVQAAIVQSAREAAECCCELKALILSNGEVTRALIRDHESARLAIQLSDAKTELALLKTLAK